MQGIIIVHAPDETIIYFHKAYTAQDHVCHKLKLEFQKVSFKFQQKVPDCSCCQGRSPPDSIRVGSKYSRFSNPDMTTKDGQLVLREQ
jgi:hypothetical protein